MNKPKLVMKAAGFIAAVALVTVMSTTPAMAASVHKSAGITGNGTIYHSKGNFHGSGSLSLTSMSDTGSCGSTTWLWLRGTSGQTAAATQKAHFSASSISFRNLSAPPGYYYTFSQGTKWFTTQQLGADAICYSGWAGTFNYPS